MALALECLRWDLALTKSEFRSACDALNEAIGETLHQTVGALGAHPQAKEAEAIWRAARNVWDPMPVDMEQIRKLRVRLALTLRTLLRVGRHDYGRWFDEHGHKISVFELSQTHGHEEYWCGRCREWRLVGEWPKRLVRPLWADAPAYSKDIPPGVRRELKRCREVRVEDECEHGRHLAQLCAECDGLEAE